MKIHGRFFFSAFHLLTQVTAATGLWQQGQLHEAAELFRETIEGGKSLKKMGQCLASLC